MVCYGMVCYSMVWHGMAWCGVFPCQGMRGCGTDPGPERGALGSPEQPSVSAGGASGSGDASDISKHVRVQALNIAKHQEKSNKHYEPVVQ